MLTDLRLRRRRGSLGMEALLILPFGLILILLGRYVFEAAITRHEVAVHTRGSAFAAAGADSISPLTCTHDSEFAQRPGVDKSFFVVCTRRNGESGLSQERPILTAMKDRASAWTGIMRDIQNEGPFDDIRSSGFGSMSFDNPPFLENEGSAANAASFMVTTETVFDHGEDPWKSGYDAVVFEELDKKGTSKLFPNVFPARN